MRRAVVEPIDVSMLQMSLFETRYMGLGLYYRSEHVRPMDSVSTQLNRLIINFRK